MAVQSSLYKGMDSSALESVDSIVTQESSMCHSLELDNCLRRGLPEDILYVVFKKLPPAAYCRFRCVCRDWKRLLSPSPDWTQARAHYTLVNALGACETKSKIFCHTEGKFFSLPFSACLFKKMNLAFNLQEPNNILDLPCHTAWDLMDVDGGLFCYLSPVVAKLCVCNPLTYSIRLIPGLVSLDIRYEGRWEQKLKLLVDRKSKTFKIVVVATYQHMKSTAIYDSTNSSWDHFDSESNRTNHMIDWRNVTYFNEMFKWRNVIYSFSTCAFRTKGACFLALDMESGQWDRVQVNFPGEQTSAVLTIVSDQKQTILVQSPPNRRLGFSVWKLRNDESSNSPDFSKWENLCTGQEEAIQRVADTHYFVRASCGPGYICFILKAHEDGPASKTPTDMFLKYSFVTKRLTLMPVGINWRVRTLLHGWEPSSEMDVGSNKEAESDYGLILAAHY